MTSSINPKVIKAIIFLLFLCIQNIYFSQEKSAANVRAGLIFASGLNFQDLKTKNFISSGPGTELTLGMNLNFNLTETIGFSTGAEFDFSNTKFDANSGTKIFYRYNDTEILRKEDLANTSLYKEYQLKSRKDKSIYLSIPTMLLFQTKLIGYFRYFGKFGLRHSILLKTESDDQSFSDAPMPTNANMTTKGNMFFYKGAIGMSAGAEWNFSGNTSLVGELGYFYGITPLYWERETNNDKLSLYTIDANGKELYHPIKARQSQLLLKVSVLF